MKKLVKNKKAQFAIEYLKFAIITLVVAVIIVTVSIQVNDTVTASVNTEGENTSVVFKEGICQNVQSDALCGIGGCNWTCTSAAYNASVLGTSGIATFSAYWSIIAIVIILAVIILLFGMFGGGGGIVIR